MREINHKLSSEIIEAASLGRGDIVAELCDQYIQFISDVSQEMLRKSNAIEQLSLKYPEYKTEISSMAQKFRDCSSRYSAISTSFGEFIKTGKVPASLTNLL